MRDAGRPIIRAYPEAVPKHVQAGATPSPSSAAEKAVGVDTEQRQAFEPAERPVQIYESALCFATQLLAFATLWTHNRLVEIVAASAVALLLAMSLWKLLSPPRLSATRCAFLLIGIVCIALLVHW